MAIVRTVDWVLRCDPSEAVQLLRAAFQAVGMKDLEADASRVRGEQKAALLKNRWACEVTATTTPHPSGAEVQVRVSMPAGTKHYEVADSIAEKVPSELFDDRGVGAALDRLGKAGRFFGATEVRHLRHIVRPTETVLEVGVGQIQGKMGLLAITTERLFFFEKGLLGSESVQEFALPSIQALSVSKQRGGERLEVAYSGVRSEITQMGHGQGDAIVRAFHQAKRTPAPEAASAKSAASDPITQLTQLAELRDAGVLTDEEFQIKKAEILARM